MPMIEAELRAAMGDFAYEQRLRKDANLKPNPRPPAHWELSTDFDEENRRTPPPWRYDILGEFAFSTWSSRSGS